MLCEKNNNTVLLLGMGNKLLGDDGLGVKAVRRINAQLNSQDEFLFLECDAGWFSAMETICGYNNVIIVDSIVSNSPPGEIIHLSFPWFESPQKDIPLHFFGIFESYHFAKSLGLSLPESIEVWGITTSMQTEFRDSLSPEIEDSMRRMVSMIVTSIKIEKEFNMLQ